MSGRFTKWPPPMHRWFLRCVRLQRAFVPAATSSEKMAAKFRLTWQKREPKSGASLARAVLFDIVEKRKGCAGGGAVSVLQYAHH